ncbi:hypothetical protein [Microbispora sp. H13382]|uniref:hypothetical protein n=1 Tax=Microbispora sp. H13382 TaxID=2729112 RepID=UPI0015FF125E|nr:hypothetical protein [Microbispora sp. H13382]
MEKPGRGADAIGGRGFCQPGAFHPAPPGPKAYPLPPGIALAGPGPGRLGPVEPAHGAYGPGVPGVFIGPGVFAPGVLPGLAQDEPGPAALGVFAGLVQGDVGFVGGGGGMVAPAGPVGADGPAGSAAPLVAVGSLNPVGPVSGSGRGPRGSSPVPRDPAS